MNTDIRSISDTLHHLHWEADHPLRRYCYAVDGQAQIHIAAKSDFIVLGVFPDWVQAQPLIDQLKSCTTLLTSPEPPDGASLAALPDGGKLKHGNATVDVTNGS